MKLLILKSKEDPLEKTQVQLERDLTPKERRWLTFADDLIKGVEKRLLRAS